MTLGNYVIDKGSVISANSGKYCTEKGNRKPILFISYIENQPKTKRREQYAEEMYRRFKRMTDFFQEECFETPPLQF